jgi:hypothetical protein
MFEVKNSQVVQTNPNFKKTNALSDRPSFSVESAKPSIFQVVNPIIHPGDNLLTINTKGLDKTNTDQFNSSSQMNSSGLAGNLKSDALNFKVKFSYKTCQIIRGEFIIRNLDKANDIRVYELIVDVKPRNIHAKLEFICPVKESIVQKIPIYNASDINWTIKGELTGAHSGFFKHDLERKINKKSQGEYCLTFAPIERYDVKATLVLTNLQTKEQYHYDLEGKADDPLAEDILTVPCNAKETVRRYIKIENNTERDMLYTVETDLPDIITGEPSFKLLGMSKKEYEIIIKPILGKTYFGKITFTDERRIING